MAMVQYGLWSNCSNRCDFCLLKESYISKKQQLDRLDCIIKNIDYIDWKDKFKHGISLIGGELYYCPDLEVKNKFIELIDVIIEKIIKVSSYPECRYSTVTNGIYQPDLLFEVMDKFKNTVGLDKVDLNFSYDLKYRFHSEESRLLCLENIRKFNERYNRKVAVQMILTQHLIEEYLNKKIDLNIFQKDTLNGNILSLLYPHKIRTGKVLKDFYFNRLDFIKFIQRLRNDCFNIYVNFINSVINSSQFKYAGFYDRITNDVSQQPLLEDDKSVYNTSCGHSILYQCYADSDKCMLCDLLNIVDKDLFEFNIAPQKRNKDGL